MKTYKAAVIGCSRMGAFIDNEVVGAPGHVPPYAHTAVFYACPRTHLAACSDIRPEVMEEVGSQFDIPKERQYTDYKELIDREQPDIVSVATQPEHRAEIVIYAVEHGARAIYAEKALCASMAEADAILEACERNGAVLNLGTQRRWHSGFVKMREVIESGRIGDLKTVVFSGSSLFNGASHHYDNLLFLNGDARATSVQMSLVEGNWRIDEDRLTEDPVSHGVIQFENDVTAYAVLSPHEVEWEASCERGTLTAWAGSKYRIREEGPPGIPGLAHDGSRPLPAPQAIQLQPAPGGGSGQLPGHGRADEGRSKGGPRGYGAHFRQHRVAPPRRGAGRAAAEGQPHLPAARPRPEAAEVQCVEARRGPSCYTFSGGPTSQRSSEVEQRFRKPQVDGSNPSVGSIRPHDPSEPPAGANG